MNRHFLHTPHFCEDPVLYGDSIVYYLHILEHYDPIAVQSARKPSTFEYDEYTGADDWLEFEYEA